MAILTHDAAINRLLDLHPDARENDAFLQSRYKQLTGTEREAPEIRLSLAARALRVALVSKSRAPAQRDDSEISFR